MPKTIILCDMDGVITNFAQGILDVHNSDIKHDELVGDYDECLGITPEEMWKPTLGTNWWLRLQPYPWAKGVVECLSLFGKVIFCTSPSRDPESASQKIEWLRLHGFMGKWDKDFVLTKHKYLCAHPHTILIDDLDYNVETFWAHGGNAVLFPQPWNNAKGKPRSRKYIHAMVAKIVNSGNFKGEN